MAASEARTKVGFIGLGAMGAPMAAQLIAHGYAVTAFDIDDKALDRLAAQGATKAANPAGVAAATDLMVLMVQDAAQVDSVLFGADGAAAALRSGATVWLATTVTPRYVELLAPRLAASDIRLIDGPVSGGVTGAQAGALTVIASGSDAALDAGHDVMSACASSVLRVGHIGAGSTMKMINQLLTAAHIALTAEALAFGVRAGVDPHRLVEVITHSAGSSRMFEKRAPRMVAGDHVPHATLQIFLKDLGIVLDAARRLDFPLPLAAAAHQVFTSAAASGHAGESDTRVLRVYEQRGGVDVAAAGAP